MRACNLLGGYLTHKEVNMRYMSLESLGHLAISDLSREAVKKHEEVVLKTLRVSELLWAWHVEGVTMVWYFCDQCWWHIVRKVLVHVLVILLCETS